VPDIYVRLARARRLIDEGYEQAPRLDVLARTAGFSRFHVIRLFRRAFQPRPVPPRTGQAAAGAGSR